MKLIYVAGPYRAANHWLIEQNIHRARELGARLAQLGAAPLIPHANTAHWDGLCSDEFWLKAGIEMLRRCDGVVLVKGWSESRGTLAEVDEAHRRGLPVLGKPSPPDDILAEWLARVRKRAMRP